MTINAERHVPLAPWFCPLYAQMADSRTDELKALYIISHKSQQFSTDGTFRGGHPASLLLYVNTLFIVNVLLGYFIITSLH